MIEIRGADTRLAQWFTPIINCVPKKAVIVKEERDYYLDLEIPYDHKTPRGVVVDYLPYLVQDNTVMADTPWGKKQAFRFNNFTYRNGIASCRAYHIGYDARRYVMKPNTMNNLNLTQSVQAALAAADATTDFTLNITASNKEDALAGASSFDVMPLLEALRIISKIWDVQLSFSQHVIVMKDFPTIPINELIQDGYNLRDMEVTENWDDVAMKVWALGLRDLSPNTTMLYDVEDTYSYPKDYSQMIRDIRYDKILRLEPQISEWYKDDDQYVISIIDNLMMSYEPEYQDGLLKVNYKIKADVKAVVDVGDIIPVKHRRLGVDILARVISIEYDTQTKRYKNVEFGNFTPRIKGYAKSVENEMQSLKTRLEKGGL